MQDTTPVSAPNHRSQVVGANQEQMSDSSGVAFAADRWQVQSQDNLGNFEIRGVNSPATPPSGGTDPAESPNPVEGPRSQARNARAQPLSSSD